MSLRLVGGEMLAFSDLDGAHGAGPARGAALAALVRRLATGRTLVAGPHDPALFDGRPDLAFLVRGAPDAEALDARFPDATVYCGALEKLAPEPPYDTVVALDGLGRLASVEGTELDWAASLHPLRSWLRPGGRLLLGDRKSVV